MDRKQLMAAKEGGRRRVLCLRFPRFYGYDRHFICRTLVRGEILRAFQSVGYPERTIPENDVEAQTLFENVIFEKSVIGAPPGVTSLTCPAGFVKTIAEQVLYHSNFFYGSSAQKVALRKAMLYANSLEGRSEALVLKYLPGVTEESLDREPYDHLFRRTYQAIIVAGQLYGLDVEKFLDPDDDLIRERQAAQQPKYDPHRQPPPAPVPAAGASPGPRAAAKTASPNEKVSAALEALRRPVPLTGKVNSMFGLKGEQIDSSQQFMFMAGEVVPSVKTIAADVNQYATNPEG